MVSLNPFELRYFKRSLHGDRSDRSRHRQPTTSRVDHSSRDCSCRETRHELKIVWQLLVSNRNEIASFKRGQSKVNIHRKIPQKQNYLNLS